MDTGQPLLEVDGVTLRYKTPEHLVTATYRVSFRVWPGDRFVLLGRRDAASRRCSRRSAATWRRPKGEIRLRGREVTEPGPDRMMVFQEFDQLLPWKTVLAERALPDAHLRPASERKDAMDRAQPR
jgi:NitT/TauT family transport system ATP-binding protein